MIFSSIMANVQPIETMNNGNGFLKNLWAKINEDISPLTIMAASNIAGVLGLWITVSGLFYNLPSRWWSYIAVLLGLISILGLIAGLQKWAEDQGARRKAANVVVVLTIIIAALIMLTPQFFGLPKVQ